MLLCICAESNVLIRCYGAFMHNCFLSGESPPLPQIFTNVKRFFCIWINCLPHLYLFCHYRLESFVYLQKCTVIVRLCIDIGLDSCMGPLDLYGGDSGVGGWPQRIQNKKFNSLVFPLRGYTTSSGIAMYWSQCTIPTKILEQLAAERTKFDGVTIRQLFTRRSKNSFVRFQ